MIESEDFLGYIKFKAYQEVCAKLINRLKERGRERVVYSIINKTVAIIKKELLDKYVIENTIKKGINWDEMYKIYTNDKITTFYRNYIIEVCDKLITLFDAEDRPSVLKVEKIVNKFMKQISNELFEYKEK